MFKFLFDIFPVLAFFGLYKWAEKNAAHAQNFANQLLSPFTTHSISLELAPIILATAIAIVLSIAQITYLLITRKKIEIMLWVSFMIITVFGGATIYFQNDAFIKWKPTLIYWCYALAMLVAQIFFQKNVLKSLLGSQVNMPDAVWNRLTWLWVCFFTGMGVLNLYVAFQYTQSQWVSFKLYSMAALPIFLIAQSFYWAKYMEDPTTANTPNE